MTNKTTTIHLVRHGKVHNPHNKYYGRLPGFHLGEEGRAQAKATAKELSQYPIAAIFSSPMERAIETAEEILNQFDGLDFQISELLSEVYTPFDGQLLSTVAERNWDVYSGTNPPYEQPSDVLGRVKEFFTRVQNIYQGGQVVAITHGDVVAFTILWALGKQLTSVQKQTLYKDYIDYASISSFTFHINSKEELPEFKYFSPS